MMYQNKKIDIALCLGSFTDMIRTYSKEVEAVQMRKGWMIAFAWLFILTLLCGCNTGTVELESSLEETASSQVESHSATETEPETTEPATTETDHKETTGQAEEISESTETIPLVKIDHVNVSFLFTRMSTHASNQLAIWVENEQGVMVRTLLVTGFTAGRRGYRNRENALSHWVEVFDPESKTDDEIDVVSSATPSEGQLSYDWNLADDTGKRVPDGIYYLKFEGTLFWESNILYTAVINTTDFTTGEQDVSVERSQPDNTENETMIQDVVITIFE